jgi:hypothetical protein
MTPPGAFSFAIFLSASHGAFQTLLSSLKKSAGLGLSFGTYDGANSSAHHDAMQTPSPLQYIVVSSAIFIDAMLYSVLLVTLPLESRRGRFTQVTICRPVPSMCESESRNSV